MKYAGLIFGAAMAIVWSVVFCLVLHSAAGIGVGVAFGAAFACVGRLLFDRKKKNDP